MFNFVELGMGEQANFIVYPVILLPFLAFIILLIIIKRL